MPQSAPMPRVPVLVATFMVSLATAAAASQQPSIIEPLPREASAARPAPELVRAFQSCRVLPLLGNHWDGLFTPGDFPEVGWERPELVRATVGDVPLVVRWYDAQLEQVQRAERSGRYLWHAHGRTASGIEVHRAGTVYCRSTEWIDWSDRPSARLDFLRGTDLSVEAWDAHRDAIDRFVGRTMMLSVLKQQEGALLMSFLHEISHEGLDDPIATPLIRDHDLHLRLKRRGLGLEDPDPAAPLLQPPRALGTDPAPILRPGSEAEAGFRPGTAAALSRICDEWWQASAEPFVTLVARDGVILFHQANGHDPDGPVTIDTPMPMASITKAFTGVLFAQFVDQGLIGIDQPVGSILPGFATDGPGAITMRHCFTHTTGLEGHAEWGGMHNPWLESTIAAGAPDLPVGRVMRYNGMGYDLAARAMEVASGVSFFRLMRTHLFDPLGCSATHLEEDPAWGASCTAVDAARIGQLLLNAGSYGGTRFFGPETLERMLPVPLSTIHPELRGQWGIGLTWMRDWAPEDAGSTGSASREREPILSPLTFGHGAATSAVLRIDPEHRLVVVQVRRTDGPRYREFLPRLLMAVRDGIDGTAGESVDE